MVAAGRGRAVTGSGRGMDKRRFKEIAGRGGYVEGIYNYCDRWCERCPFASRCLTFALGEEQFADPQTRDASNQAFWGQMSDMFSLTMDMLRESLAERGIEIPEKEVAEAVVEERRQDARAEENQCAVAARAYVKLAGAWLASAAERLQAKEDELNLHARLELPGDDPHGRATEVADALDVVRWYQHQIYVKLKRALRGSMDEIEMELGEEFPKDSDGSAKVALLGMDRSIAAWGILREHVGDAEDKILDILVHLDRLRRAAERDFPQARAFVRPGFDEAPAG